MEPEEPKPDPGRQDHNTYALHHLLIAIGQIAVAIYLFLNPSHPQPEALIALVEGLIFLFALPMFFPKVVPRFARVIRRYRWTLAISSILCCAAGIYLWRQHDLEDRERVADVTEIKAVIADEPGLLHQPAQAILSYFSDDCVLRDYGRVLNPEKDKKSEWHGSESVGRYDEVNRTYHRLTKHNISRERLSIQHGAGRLALVESQTLATPLLGSSKWKPGSFDVWILKKMNGRWRVKLFIYNIDEKYVADCVRNALDEIGVPVK